MASKAKTRTVSVARRESSEGNDILIKGAREHNLKNIDVRIPRGRLVVVTGVSGSGKSSLTMDTLFAEGQRRYAESLSAYVRQFLMRMNKPDVDYIRGICPAIAVEQKVISKTSRSTVGSMTEIYDYLKLLFARIGKTYSPVSGQLVRKHDVSDVVDFITGQPEGARVHILLPFPAHGRRSPAEELSILLQKGFSRLYRLGEGPERMEEVLEKKSWKPDASTYVLVDRLVVRAFGQEDLHRIADSVQTGFYESEGDCMVEVEGQPLHHFSSRFELDGLEFEEPSPNLFSFNNPLGACPVCEGFGHVLGIDPDLVIPDPSLSVYEGAIACWKGEKMSQWNKALLQTARKFGFPVHKPVQDLSPEQYRLLWTGNDCFHGIDAFFRMVEENLYKIQYRVLLSRYRGRTVCHSCKGSRLRKEALYVKVGNADIGQLSALPVSELKAWFSAVELNEFDRKVAHRILVEIHQRLDILLDVGLGYLTLSRMANTLSGGESQRIQLTRLLGSNLTDSLYILDEPSIGLHTRDTERLIRVLKRLRDLGNTVVVVEHDELMMKECDYIIDMGPLASHLGGEVVACGPYRELLASEDSLTAKYLSGRLKLEPRSKPRRALHSIVLEGCREHNLKNIRVEFPLGVLTVVSGVSGSGKTTLVKSILYPALKKQLGEPGDKPGPFRSLGGDVSRIDQVELVDQEPIGKSSRSNPVTYVKAYDEIRQLFAAQPLSRIRNFEPRHFSFNVDAGRCDTCKGEGEVLVEMQFLADVHLVCETCGGKRFKEEVLEVRYRDKNIFEVLDMSVDEALAFFAKEEAVLRKLQPLSDVGLGYIKLGQSSDTLSGGEAQRVKLASFLGRGKNAGHILFIFDEPTTGLHFHDIKKLLASFEALIGSGHSLLVIEHNLDVIRAADWVIDLGPEAGSEGGFLVYAGPPAGLKKVPESATGRYI